MKIFEIADIQPVTGTPSPEKLLGLVQFLSGRAEDSQAQKEISQDAFISVAQSLGINVSKENLADLTIQPPLSNVLEPLQPNTNDPIVYKGGGNGPEAMPVNKAQDIVANAAKSAAKKDRSI
jgi:hypothetical protein